MHEVVLCAEEESLRDPSMIGLEGESLDTQQWLLPLSSAEEVRGYVRENAGVEEVWVASSNDMDPINLAAALKHDSRNVKVRLVAWKDSGSLRSRAAAAGIDEVMGYAEMARRYAAMKDVLHGEGFRQPMPERAFDEAFQAPTSFDFDEVATPELAGNGPMDGGAAFSAPASSPRRGFALCVVSASGGTGKSTIAALSALIAAGHGYRTALIDADLQFGDVASMFEESPSLSVDQAIANPHLLDEVPLQPARPLVVAAPERIEQSELYLPQMPGLIERARESFDVVVVNTGSFWTEAHVQMMEVCSNTLFLMDQRPTSVNAVRKALELCARCGVAAHPFLFAVNRCTRKALLSALDISCALDGVSVAELKEGGAIVSEFASSGMAVQLVADRNDLCLSLNDFLGGVIPVALGASAPDLIPRDGGKGASKGKSKRKVFKKKGKAACL